MVKSIKYKLGDVINITECDFNISGWQHHGKRETICGNNTDRNKDGYRRIEKPDDEYWFKHTWDE